LAIHGIHWDDEIEVCPQVIFLSGLSWPKLGEAKAARQMSKVVKADCAIHFMIGFSSRLALMPVGYLTSERKAS
jgi:hypothetical protein